MAYSWFNKLISGYLLGTELLPVDNGGGIEVGATSGQIANAPGPAGSGAGTFGRSGNINTTISSAGLSPGNTGGDYVVAFFALPASSFDIANRAMQIQAAGSFAANGNTKRVKVQVSNTLPVVGNTIASATAIADSTAVTTNGGGWQFTAELTKYGAAGSNTQIAIHNVAQGVGSVALLAPQLLTLTENATIYVALTANCTTTATDVVFNFLQSFWQN